MNANTTQLLTESEIRGRIQESKNLIALNRDKDNSHHAQDIARLEALLPQPAQTQHTPGHTKGSWIYDGQRYVRAGHDGGIIAELWAGKIDGAVAELNARLIAAAPELLAALEYCRREYLSRGIKEGLGGPDGSPLQGVALRLATDALAKAQGQ